MSDFDDRVTVFGDEYTQYLETYHPGTGAMVAMGCEDTEIGYDHGRPSYGQRQHMAEIGYDQSGLSYDDGVLMTQIGGDVGSHHFTGHHNFADIGYDMYSEYNASENQFAPYMGFGPGMAQTDYPHGPGYDEPDMGFDIGGRRVGGGGSDTRGAAISGGLAAGGAAVGLHFGGPPGALIGAAIGGAIRSLIG
jgi:hypothetical protein